MTRRGLRTGDRTDGRPGTGRRPWFGPKRIGWGLRPVTWQGWLVTVAAVAAIYLIVRLIHG